VTTLAFDSATPRPSLAVVDGDRTLAELNLGAADGGGRRVLEAVHEALAAAEQQIEDVDRLVVGVGPGGFTGIRIGIATALGLGQALGAPVVGASSLEALALGIGRAAPGATIVATAIDARRGEVFGAVYRLTDGWKELVAPRAADPKDFAGIVAGCGSEVEIAVGGSGVAAYAEAFDQISASALRAESDANYPKAVDLIRRADGGGALTARPVYCRLPDAEEKRLAREAAR